MNVDTPKSGISKADAMEINELNEWLYRNGGPAIQLNIVDSTNNDSGNVDMNAKAYWLSRLLNIEKVSKVLSYLDGFDTQSRDNKTFEHLIHYYKETCIENFFPTLVDLGFRAGMPIFDEKMHYVREIYSYMLNQCGNDGSIVELDYCYNYRLMLHQFFFMAGYAYDEVIESMVHRVNKLYAAAKERIYDIYQDKSKLPKVPDAWMDHGVLKDDMNPFSPAATKPLPSIYDIKTLAYMSNLLHQPSLPHQPQQPHHFFKNAETDIQAKIDEIIDYILTPQFQQIPEGYGIIWVKHRRIYHACGWNPMLPCYDDYERPRFLCANVLPYYLRIMSHFKTAHKSKWFKESLNHLEQFKSERGTYAFPQEYLLDKRKYIKEAYLNADDLKLQRGEREYKLREIVSTLYMFLIKRQLCS